MAARQTLIAIAAMVVTPILAGAAATAVQELSIETILAQHSKLNGKIVRFRGMLVSGGMGNQGLCSGYGPQGKCLWFGGNEIFLTVRSRDPNATRFIVQGRLNDQCIRQECTDVFTQIESPMIVGRY